MKKTNTNTRLFYNGFLYVFLQAASTFCIARLFWLGIALFGFLISFLWVVNVKRAAVSTMRGRMVYATGAMLGALSGVLLMKFLEHLIKVN